MAADKPGDLGGPCSEQTAWRREVKSGAAIYEANRIAAAKSKREDRKSQVPCLFNANRFQHARAANAHFEQKLVSRDILGPSMPTIRQRLLPPLSPLPQTPRRSLPPSPPIALLLPRRHQP
nr:unnamed protein product [Spirometra erinaceieuropaei]